MKSFSIVLINYRENLFLSKLDHNNKVYCSQFFLIERKSIAIGVARIFNTDIRLLAKNVSRVKITLQRIRLQ